MAVRNMQDWHRDASDMISTVRNSQQNAARQHEHSQRAHGATISDNLTQYTELRDALDRKVKTSYRLVEKLRKRSESMENGIDLTKQSLKDLETANHAKDAPLKLCVWRMEQREGRPLREQMRDMVSPALEAEKADLINSQKKLASAIRDTKVMIFTLETKMEGVKSDLAQKVQALSLDEACYESTHRSFQTAIDRTPSQHKTAVGRLPAAVGKNGANHADMNATGKNEVGRQREAEAMDRAAVAQEQDANALREDSARLILNTTNSAREHCARSEAALQEGIKQNQQIRTRLENEIRETETKIERTKATMVQTQEQIHALNEPLRNVSGCAGFRTQREHREQIQDPVSTKIAEHQSSLLRNQESLNKHNLEEKKILKELEEHRNQLLENLRDKTSAMHIALVCLGPAQSGKQAPSTLSGTATPRSRGISSSRGRMVIDRGLTSARGAPMTAR